MQKRRLRVTLAVDLTGAELVSELSQEGDSISVRLLIREAARIVDRLAKLDLILSGDVATWMRVVTARDSVIEVRVDHALAEARQQTTALRHLLVEIDRQRGGVPAGGDGDQDGLDGL